MFMKKSINSCFLTLTPKSLKVNLNYFIVINSFYYYFFLSINKFIIDDDDFLNLKIFFGSLFDLFSLYSYYLFY